MDVNKKNNAVLDVQKEIEIYSFLQDAKTNDGTV
tara:strand:- start:359 stop:460 length:102 start_codon:yes stop_codon:yes gene_type:complete